MEGRDAGQANIFMRYTCPACGARFPTLHDKKTHLRTEHPRGGPRAQ